LFGNKKSNASTASSAASSSATSSSAAADPLSVKLAGDDVPEKFQGKTVQEVLTIYKDTEAKRVHAEAEARQWLRLMQESDTKSTTPKVKEIDPADILDVDALQAITALTNKAIAPLVGALGNMQKQYLRDTRDDFSQFEERADEVFGGMKPEHQFHPKYGYAFAFNLARAETMDTKQKKTTGAPAPTIKDIKGPKPEGLSEVQKKYAKMMGLSDEKYKEYMEEKNPLGDQG